MPTSETFQSGHLRKNHDIAQLEGASSPSETWVVGGGSGRSLGDDVSSFFCPFESDSEAFPLSNQLDSQSPAQTVWRDHFAQ